MQIRKITIPRTPFHVTLGKNGKVLPDDEITRIKSLIKAEGKYSKKILGSTFPCVFYHGRYYILCKHDFCSKGAYGKVIPAQDADTGEFIAFKVITSISNQVLKQFSVSSSESDSDIELSIENEAEFLADVGLAIVDTEGKPIKISHTTTENPAKIKYMLAMRWLSGLSVGDCHLERYPFIVTLVILEQMLQEVKRTHEHGILHRDLKTDNFMFDFKTHKVNLIDFGFARYMDNNNVFYSKSVTGTTGYIAPEIYDVFDFDSDLKKNKRKSLLGKIKNDLMALENPTKESIKNILCTNGIYSAKTEIYAMGKAMKSISPDERQYVTAETRMKYVDQYEKMKNLDPAQRPSIDSCIRFIQDLQRHLTPKEKTFRVAIVDIRYFDGLRKSSGEIFNENIRYSIFRDLDNYQRVIFYDSHTEPDIDLYKNVLDDVLGCRIFNVLNEVYLAPLGHELIQKIHAELTQQHPLYLFKYYAVRSDKALELQPSPPHPMHKFGVFNAAIHSVEVNDDVCSRHLLA